jgi:putative tricarboxylic transport membrane protein
MDERGSSEPRDDAPGSLFGPRIVAVVLVVGGGFLVAQALSIARGGGYTVVGPVTIPLFVAIGLVALGVALGVRTALLPDRDLAVHVHEQERATHWRTVGLLGLLLVAYGLALDGFTLGPIDLPGLGYIVATALFLPATARALGSGHLLRDVAIGVGVAVVVYFGFTEFLGVRLPAGILGPIL